MPPELAAHHDAVRAPRIVALADDLTGANALAARLAGRGYRARTAMRQGVGQPADALVIDTATRDRPPRYAARRASATLEAVLRRAPEAFIAKRIDRTFRGPIHAEVVAMLAMMPVETLALVAPAAPAAGRTVRDGVLRYPGGPQHGLSVHHLLTQHVSLPLVPLPLGIVRASLDQLSGVLRCTRGAVMLADAETDEDIVRLADAAARLGRPLLPVDPGGLTAELAVRLRPPPGRVLAVLGTLTPLSGEQRRRATGHFRATAHPVSAENLPATDLIWACTERVCLLYQTGEQPSLATQRRLVLAVRSTVEQGDVRGLFLSGGHTARRVLRALGASGVRVERQIEPLVAYGSIEGGPWHGLSLVTKGGMVGDDETLIRCLTLLLGESSHG